jgi:hypothetical protein
MLMLLLQASLLFAQDAFLDCSNAGAVETQLVRGPAGETARVQASTHDDSSKNSHDCMADYELIVQPAHGGVPVTIDFLSSDGDWGRKLSVHFDGFSADGKRIFGTLMEGGTTPTAMVLDYHRAGQSVEPPRSRRRRVGPELRRHIGPG